MSADYFDLGGYARSITTRSADARMWFNRGLIWCYGFNHEEALRCFYRARRYDPDCAMVYWGMTYASGPFYNKPWEWFGGEERKQAVAFCFKTIHKAQALSGTASDLEQGLITALAERHQQGRVVSMEEFARWNDRYADRMREVHAAFPEDPDVMTLCAESLMNRTPWFLWDVHNAVPAGNADTLEAIGILERGLARIHTGKLDSHPGLLHYYLHALEMSPFPERARTAADRLRFSVPESGHLLHMASHIDVLCGHYAEALAANDRAIVADEKYLRLKGAREFYLISCVHNCHMKMYAAMFMGRYQAAMDAADRIRSIIAKDMLRIDRPYLASTLEAYHSMTAHVRVRFGRWRDIIDESLPVDTDIYLITSIMLEYAKGVAHAAVGETERALGFQDSFNRHLQDVPEWHVMGNNRTLDILAIAGEMLNGEIEYRLGNFSRAFQYLRTAVQRSDDLKYAEPWAWMHPPRHALGALLLEQDHVEEAMTVYRMDLGLDDGLPRCLRHPDNVWALHGYAECLQRSGRCEEAAGVQTKLHAALQHADIEISSSCCCRRVVS